MFDGCLTMAFHTLNYPSHKLGYANTQRSLDMTRLNWVLAVPPSPFLLHTDESGKFSESTRSDSNNSLLALDNTVRVIGGVSVDSTLKFLRKLVQWGSKDELGSHNIPMPSLGGKTEREQLDPTPIVENLRSKRVFLENSGARCVLMPCHVSHSWHEEVSKGSNVPLLHMGECVARQLKEAKLKPIEAIRKSFRTRDLKLCCQIKRPWNTP